MDKRIGAQLYTLRNYCQTLEDLDKTLKKVKDIGFKTIQASGINAEISGKEIKELTDKYGLETIVTHRPMDEFLTDIDKVIKFHKDLGCNIAGLGGAPMGLRTDKDELKKFIKDFNFVSTELKKEGITFGYHNHAFEFRRFDGKTIFDYILEETDPEYFKLIVDIFWLAYAGVDPVRFLKEKLYNRTIIAHFKDLKIRPNNSSAMGEVGYGNILWDEVIEACKAVGCQAAMVEQDDCNGEDEFECMKRSYDYLTTKGFI